METPISPAPQTSLKRLRTLNLIGAFVLGVIFVGLIVIFWPKSQQNPVQSNTQGTSTDAVITAGKKYYYRVCDIEASGEIFCGNIMTVSA